MSLDAITPTSAPAPVSGVGARPGNDAGAAQSAPQTTQQAPAAQAAPAPAPAPDAAAKAADLEAARQAANHALQKSGRELAFEFDDASNRMIARLIDTKTKEVLRQVPSVETIAIAKALAEERPTGVLLKANA